MVLVRKIKKNDLPRVFELLQELSNYIPQRNEKELLRQFRKNSFGYVATVNAEHSQVIAFAQLSIIHKIRGGKIGIIEDVIVAEEFRRAGIGSKLLNELISKAKELDCYKIVLACDLDKRSFYSKLGFLNNGISLKRFI